MSVAAQGIEALQEAVRRGPHVLPHGAGTKPALSTPPEGVVALDVSGLSGLLEYDPAELTFTARGRRSPRSPPPWPSTDSTCRSTRRSPPPGPRWVGW